MLTPMSTRHSRRLMLASAGFLSTHAFASNPAYDSHAILVSSTDDLQQPRLDTSFHT
jgi:hypothetical protein